jgi:hypothetical protein
MKARELAKHMMEYKFQLFMSDSLLPLIIPKSAIEPGSIHPTANIEDAPMLQLTAAALERGILLELAGGRHHKHASEIIKKMSEERTKKYREEIEDLKTRLEKAKEGSLMAENLAKKVRLWEAQIKMEIALQKTIGIWGVVLYDEGRHTNRR